MDRLTREQDDQLIMAAGVRVGCPWLDEKTGEPEILLLVQLNEEDGVEDWVYCVFDPIGAVALAKKVLSFADQIHKSMN